MRLRPVAGRDAAIRAYLECNHVFDEATGELADLSVLPPYPDDSKQSTADDPPRNDREVNDA